MESLKRYAFVSLVMVMLSACQSHQSNVTIAWDSPTTFVDGGLIRDDYELQYDVCFISTKEDTQKKRCLMTPPQAHIKTIRVQIFNADEAKVNGPYIVAVRAVHFDQGKTNTSKFARSDNEKDTNGKPFTINIHEFKSVTIKFIDSET